MNNVIGMFYESPDGTIVKSVSWIGSNKMVGLATTESCYSISYNEFQSYKPKPDLNDFPGNNNPELPYEFDLIYNIKYLKDLKRDMDRYKGLVELIQQYNIEL